MRVPVARLQWALYAGLCLLGFWAPWVRAGSAAARLLWLAAAMWLADMTGPGAATQTGGAAAGGLTLEQTTLIVTGVAVLAALAGAALRVSAATAAQAQVEETRAVRRVADAGSALLALAISILMPVGGAVFFLVTSLLTCLCFHAFLAQRDLAAEHGRGGPAARPGWRIAHALLMEIFPVGCALAFVALGWRYNAVLLEQALLVSAGAAIVATALLPLQAGVGPQA